MHPAGCAGAGATHAGTALDWAANFLLKARRASWVLWPPRKCVPDSVDKESVVGRLLLFYQEAFDICPLLVSIWISFKAYGCLMESDEIVPRD